LKIVSKKSSNQSTVIQHDNIELGSTITFSQ